jgi:hypothetical protein
MTEQEEMINRLKQALALLPMRVDWVERNGRINIHREEGGGHRSELLITEYILHSDDWGLLGGTDAASSVLRAIAKENGAEFRLGPDETFVFRKAV